MVFDKWRARRQSAKELHKHEAALREEHFKLREIERRLSSADAKPPAYGAVVSLSSEEVAGQETRTGPRTSLTSGASGMPQVEVGKLDHLHRGSAMLQGETGKFDNLLRRSGSAK